MNAESAASPRDRARRRADTDRPGTPAATSLLFQVALPGSAGGTTCTVSALLPRPPSAPVVLVIDGPHNTGVSADLVFDLLAAEIRTRLPHNSPEPVWFRRYPEAAIAAWLLTDGGTTTDCLMLPSRGGWTARPVPSALTRRLLGQSPKAAPRSLRSCW